MCFWDTEAIVLRSWELVLPLVWPSQNDLGANSRGHLGWGYRKHRAKFEGCLRKFQHIVPVASGFRRAFMLRSYGKRCRDYDYANLVGGGKPLVDSMVKLGYLVDDRPNTFQASYHQSKDDAGENQVYIRLEEIALVEGAIDERN